VGFSFKHGEPVPRAIRRIAAEELKSAAEGLRGSTSANRDRPVHETRKSIKKVRAILRLMSGELGPVAEAENELLRDLARKVSPLRDAAVLVETFDDLSGRQNGAIDAALLARIRAELVRNLARVAKTSEASRSPATIAFALERAAKRARAWPVRTGGFNALAPGLARAIRRGRKRLKEALAETTPVRCHEFRKRVKDHWYHVRLLEKAWTQETKRREKDLKKLETLLGDDHNLEVLGERVAAFPWPGTAPIRQAIAERQIELRQEALALGQLIYAPKADVFVEEARALWDAWQEQPARRRSPQHRVTQAAEREAPAA